jgi:hypothetical protein
MPYIKRDKRLYLRSHLDYADSQDVGELTYCFYVLCLNYIKRKGLRYETLAAVNGALTNTIQEIYRRIVAPYEDGKILENGDIH